MWLILLLVLLVIVEIAVTMAVAAWQVGPVFLFFTVVVALVVLGVRLLSRQTPLPPDSESSEWQPKPRTRDPDAH